MIPERPTLLNGAFRRSIWACALVAAALILCAVAIVNGGPIYYPDTGAYLIDADKLVHLRAPFAVRPVFYGLAIWPFHSGVLFFPALLVQAFVVAHVVYLTQQCCDCRLRPLGFLILITALVLLTPVSFHVSHLLPDIFVGVLILALFLLIFCADRLSRAEIVYLVLIAGAAISFHLTAIPVSLALLALSLVYAVLRHRSWSTPLLAATPILLAVLLSLGFSAIMFHRLTFTPKNPPHLLARILADGPGREFLRRTCPGSRLMLCEYQDRLTSVEDDFLWRLLPSIPPADAFRIKAEQAAVIRGTVEAFPVQVVEHMLSNAARQLITFQSETQVSQAEWDEFQAGNKPLARSLKHSLQAQRYFERPALDWINGVHQWTALVSFLAAVVLAALAYRSGLLQPLALTATVLVGLLANAFACGAFGGVFARYQGRVVWLLPLAAIVAALVLLRARSCEVGAVGRNYDPRTDRGAATRSPCASL